jgi:NAD(P)-dependent dehydrogenase (short-subunit alcohol dehydrogenase family)
MTVANWHMLLPMQPIFSSDRRRWSISLPDKKKVLVTGASGLIGQLVIEHLGHKYDLSGLARRPVVNISSLQADITDAEAISPAFEGIHTVLHLAAATTGLTETWDATFPISVQGTLNVYEAARKAGVKRVVFMSSGNTQLGFMFDRTQPYWKLANMREDDPDFPTEWRMITIEDGPYPNNPYAVAKSFGENLGLLYSELHGISTLAIKLGGVLKENRPHVRGIWPGFLDQMDAVDMIDRCISAPENLMYDAFNAISNNKWRWREIQHGADVLGWIPKGSAEIAAERDGISPGHEHGPSTPSGYKGYQD